MMKEHKVNSVEDVAINILLADDNREDHVFFDNALKAISFSTELVVIEDGEKLMSYLFENSENLPDVLFLHHNMPCDNGPKCLSEIKLHPKLKELPVIIYSASLHEDVADMLYNKGAHHYIRKTNIDEFKQIVEVVFAQIAEKKFIRPSREEFMLYYSAE